MKLASVESIVRALIKPLAPELPVRFVSIATLIRMKEAAGREQDRVDVEHLRTRIEEDGGGREPT